jgi:importin subunit beta-1
LRSFADQSIAYVLPNLLPLLIKDRNQEYKYDDDEECTIPTLAAHCLSLFALCSRELVLPETIKFLQSNLLVENTIESLVLWNQKEASIMAFGSIIQGPCPLKTKPLVDQVSI